MKNNNNLSPIHIDFETNQINESFLLMFGTVVKMILRRMFGQDVYLPEISVSGSPQQMESFARALAGEKRYFESYIKHGLNDPQTYRDKYKLDAAVNQFTRDTGIQWPFK